MAGNSYVPDVMLFLGSNERHGRHIFPTGLGMPFPPAGTKGAYLAHLIQLDLNLS